jgi:hypothetical protein
MRDCLGTRNRDAGSGETFPTTDAPGEHVRILRRLHSSSPGWRLDQISREVKERRRRGAEKLESERRSASIMTIKTAAGVSAGDFVLPHQPPTPPSWPISIWAIVAALLASLVLTRLRAARLWIVLPILLGIMAIAGLGATGCGSASHTLVGGTPTGSSKIVVTATSGTLSHTITVTLNVQ